MGDCILQISDIHLLELEHGSLSAKMCVDYISDIVSSIDNGTIILAICGDLTSKGENTGYEKSIKFISSLKRSIKRTISVISVPGNHDIVKTERGADRFSAYNMAAWSFGHKVMLSESAPVNSIVIEGYVFLIINSAFHGDHKKGRVDCDAVAHHLKIMGLDNFIVIIHHHLIPYSKDNGSSLINSLELLELLSSYNIVAVLHGHTHSGSISRYGDTAFPIIGVGSLFYPPDLNYNNSFNVIEMEGNTISRVLMYRYIADIGSGRGTRGGFQLTEKKIKAIGGGII